MMLRRTRKMAQETATSTASISKQPISTPYSEPKNGREYTMGASQPVYDDLQDLHINDNETRIHKKVQYRHQRVAEHLFLTESQ